jgi:hypothetical protein
MKTMTAAVLIGGLAAGLIAMATQMNHLNHEVQIAKSQAAAAQSAAAAAQQQADDAQSAADDAQSAADHAQQQVDDTQQQVDQLREACEDQARRDGEIADCP